MNDINSLAHSNANYQSTNRQILGRNKPILRQALLWGDMPSQLVYPSALSIERLKISMSR